MIPLADARQHVLDRIDVVPPEPVALWDALGLVLAETVEATEAVPPFANTAMDGFAVRSADTAGADTDPVHLTVIETIAAGHAPTGVVGPGQASRIFTGAPMPDGADAVVIVENTSAVDAATDTVAIRAEARPGDHVRLAGEDIAVGDTVFEPGTVLTPARLGVLSSLGARTVTAHRRIRVGVVSTGDELVEGPEPLRPGQIRESNRVGLSTLAAEAGCDIVDLGIARDDEAEIEAAIRAGVDGCDAVFTSGGVSMGDIDLVKVVLDRIGDMRWMQIAIRPAKPFAFGLVEGIPVFGYPGNPVSSMVSFELFGRPAVRKMMGHRTLDRPRVVGVADAAMSRRADGKIHFVRVLASFGHDGRVHVSPAPGQGSHQLAAMAGSNALAVLPDGEDVDAGDDVDVLLLRDVSDGAERPPGRR